MAVYKPTYCYPYLEAVDLAIPDGEKYFTCQIDTSNSKITGYRVELYNENNEKVFSSNGGKISPLSELNDMGNTLGLNGSELRFPFVQHWDSKIYPSYNAIYFKATNYVDYYQKANENVSLAGAQIKDGYLTDRNGVPIFIDGSLLFVGDVFILVNRLYKVTLSETAVTEGLSLDANAIVYVKGGDTNAGAILSYNGSEFVDASGSAWCDIAENPLTISNNGKTYKWQITLYSGERGATRITGINSAAEINYDDLADSEFNTFLTSGTILGSTVDRIQGPVSDKIYAKQWLQLLNAKGEQIGQRTLIDSYSQSLGYIYPATGSLRSFTNDNLYSDTADQSSIATQFEIYKYSNNPDNLVGQEKIEHSINFSMMGNGATYNYGSYQYVVEGYQNIADFNQACGTDYPQLCQIDNNGQALYAGQQVLLWNITIVDQDLTAENFIPVNNTYYRHTGGTTETFVHGNVYLCVISYTGDAGAQEEVVTYTLYTDSQNPITGLFTISYTPPIEGAIVKQGTQTLAWPNRIFSVTTWDYISKTTPSGGVEYVYRAAIGTSIRLPDTVSDVKVTKADGSIIELTSTNTLIESHPSDRFSNNTLYNYYYARVVGNILYLTTEGERTFAETQPFGVRIYLRNDGITGATVSYTYTEASPPKFVFDMISSYRKVSAYIGKVFFINSGPFAGTNIISEASASSTNDVVELGVPIVFKQEKPLEIYPTATVPASKTRGKIYKNNIDRDNNVGTVYVSPFVGLSAGARLYVTDGSVIQAKNVDTTSWSVTYETSEEAVAYSSIEPLKYEIRTNFKASDELPFYAYDTPRAVMWSEEALEVKDNSGHTFLLEFEGRILTVSVGASSNVHNRFVKVTGQYLQSQNVSWTNYRWLLVDQNGDVIQDTGKKYGGSIQTIFYGLQGPTIEEVEAGTAEPTVYYIRLMIEDELNNSLITAMKINVSLDLANLAANFNGVFDCKTHSVELEIVPHSNSRNDQKVYSIYKKEDVEGITYYSPVAINIRVDAAEDKAVVRDFNVATGHKYKYIVYAAASTDGGSVSTVQSTAAKELSETISPDWDCWSLTELVPTTITTESPAIKKAYTADTRNVWLFKYDVESGEQTQNISKTEQKTLGQFPRFAHGRQNNISSSVSCYLGSEIINLGCLPENEKIPYAQGYVERLPWKANLTTNQKVAMLQEWRKIVASKNPKLIKDRKGQAFIVQVTSGSNKPTDNIGYQPDKINFSWTQIASLNDTIITGNK